MLEKQAGDVFLKEFEDALPTDRVRQSNHSTLMAAFAAVAAGDLSAIGSHLTDDVAMNIRGVPYFAGTWRGKEVVVKQLHANFAMVGKQEPVIEGLIGEGNQIALLIRESGVFTESGKRYDLRLAQWFHFEDGKISRFDEIVVEI